MGRVNFADWKNAQVNQANNSQNKNGQKSQGTGIGFFTLKNDKDRAIVRFMHDSPDDFDIVAGHRMTVGDKLRMVNCIREAGEPMEKCPLCAAGKKLEYKLYIHLIEYTRDEQGKVVATPRIWERSSAYINTLTNLINEYGPLSESIFTVTRNGEAGSKSTSYDVMYGNPNVYKSDLYPRNDEVFKNYTVVGKWVIDNDYDTLVSMVNPGGAQEATPKTTPVQAPQTTYQQPVAQQQPVQQAVEAPQTTYVAPPVINNNNTSGGVTPPAQGQQVTRPTRYY